jgi:hypothetical protein
MFDYLYYRFYLVGKLVGNQDEPKSKAMYCFLVFQLFNLFTIAMFGADLGFIPHVILYPIHGIIITGILIALNYFYFYKRNQKIQNKFKNENNRQKKFGFIILAVYVIITALLFYLCLPADPN